MKTNSRAQDALRAGFQVTCSKGLAKLFKLDELTRKSCEDFKEQVKSDIEKAKYELTTEYPKELSEEFSFWTSSSWAIFGWRMDKQKPRQYTVEIEEVGKPKLDLNAGRWETPIKIKIIEHKWSGWYRGKRTSFYEEIKHQTRCIITDAKVAQLKFTDYDVYANKYIPDEAIATVNDAIEIGITDIKVVEPEVVNSPVDHDPIIVGFIGDTMYLLVWFGYDKSKPMACNM